VRILALIVVLFCMTVFSSLNIVAAERPEVKAPLPVALAPVSYRDKNTDEPIARLKKRLADGEAELRHEPERGYLKSLLRELDIPVSSQVLLYSKTSLNRRLISPQTPRAIYFNDETYVGWVPGIKALEISTADPLKGTIFYTLPQDGDKPVAFRRADNCLACHATSNSLQVPGHIVRSFFTDNRGEPIEGRSWINHDTPLKNRWGGWYVSGQHGEQPHMGNLMGKEMIQSYREDPLARGNVTDLSPYFDAGSYLSPHSDIVALMVLDHQAYLQNLLARYSIETQLKREPNVEEFLLRYLFFIDEAPLTEEMIGVSGFTESFEMAGPEDPRGRSLRQFDLRTRLFKYRLSYQIYAPAFQQMPAEAKERLYQRIWQVLIGADPDEDYQKIPAEERQVILEILRATLKDLPEVYLSREVVQSAT